jgi:Family of unknown function (DUF5343)
MATLPYVSTAGNIEKALQAIKAAATPPSVSQDFVKTILQISGGSGNQMTSYLRKVGFVNEDGSPSDIYKKFRNSATEGSAAAAALKVGYKPLYARNEYMHQLTDEKLRGLIIEETGWGNDAATVTQTVYCIKQLKKFANWDASPTEVKSPQAPQPDALPYPSLPKQIDPDAQPQQFRMQLGYTINLNLPATSDIAVFNAIFTSLKENLLKNSDG